MNFTPKLRRIASFLLACLPFVSLAQDSGRSFQSYTVNEGLPQNYLLGLAQDSIGFIWIGTKDGLARYDGYQFLIYRHGRDSARTPAANNITNLYTDHRGYLWIQYDNRAIDRYNPSTGIFEHITNGKSWELIRSQLGKYELLVDHLDNLWIATENAGVFRYSSLSGQLQAVSSAPPDHSRPPASSSPVRAMMEDHEGNIWLASQNAFTVYVRKAIKHYTIPDGMLDASNAANLVIDSYKNNDLEYLGLPMNKEPDQLSLEERGKLLDLSHVVLETAILSQYGLKSYENFEAYSICKKNLENIGKGYNISDNSGQLFNLENLPDLQTLFKHEHLDFDEVFKLRHLAVAKYYRQWINTFGESGDQTKVTSEYLNSIKGNSKFFETKGGKFLKNLASFGVSTALGTAVTSVDS